VHAERGTAKVVEGATRSDRPIQQDRLTAWRDERTDDEMAELHRAVGDLVDFFGYSLDDPGKLDTFADSASPRRTTLTGNEIVARKTAFPAQALLLERPVVPWAGNQMLTPQAFGRLTRKGSRAAKKTAEKKAESAPQPRALLGGFRRRFRRR
jgi:hypothetical protein